MKKRILSLVLISTLAFSFSMPANAANSNDSFKEEQVKGKEFKNNNKKDKYYQNLMQEQLSTEEIAFIDNIIKIKEENSELTAQEVVSLVFGDDSRYDNKYNISGDEPSVWDSLTDDEKLLVVLFPLDALQVNACKKKADELTNSRYPNWKDGDKGNAFRHAIWNALMADAIGKTTAKLFADAHEAVINPDTGKEYTDAELQAINWYGADGLEHKNMDLHNNAEGRDCSYWYDVFVSAETLADRVQDKIDNGDMVILFD